MSRELISRTRTLAAELRDVKVDRFVWSREVMIRTVCSRMERLADELEAALVRVKDLEEQLDRIRRPF